VDLFRPRSVNGLEAARQHLVGAILHVRLLLHRPAALGRIDLHAVGPAIAPSRALMTSHRQAYGDDRFALERVLLKGQRIDQDGARVARNGVSVALGVDAIIHHMPAPDASHYFLDGHRVRFAHRCLRISLE
jgi:hypothetical protein